MNAPDQHAAGQVHGGAHVHANKFALLHAQLQVSGHVFQHELVGGQIGPTDPGKKAAQHRVLPCQAKRQAHARGHAQHRVVRALHQWVNQADDFVGKLFGHRLDQRRWRIKVLVEGAT